MIRYVPYHEGYESEDMKFKDIRSQAFLRAIPLPTCTYICEDSIAARGMGSRRSSHTDQERVTLLWSVFIMGYKEHKSEVDNSESEMNQSAGKKT